jgi:hypothetical protein
MATTCTLTFQYKTKYICPRDLSVQICDPFLAFLHVKYLEVGKKGMMGVLLPPAFYLVRQKLLNSLFF